MRDRTTRRRALLSLAAAPLVAPRGAFAQSPDRPYPDREIRLVVPFPPGGGTDAWARLLADRLAARLGRPVVVDNRSGANTQLGANLVARAEPDGHTLLFTSASFIQQPALFPNLPFDVVRDFAPVGQLGTTPLVFVVASRVRAATMAEFVALARGGERVAFGSYAQASAGAVFGEYLSALKGLDMTIVHYRGEAPVATDLVGGTVRAAFLSVPTARPLIEAGSVRPLGVLADGRPETLPDVPTFAEQGIDELSWRGVWLGVFAPARVPRPILARLAAEVRAAAAEPALVRDLAARDLVVSWQGPDAFAATIRDNMASWSLMVERLGIRGQ